VEISSLNLHHQLKHYLAHKNKRFRTQDEKNIRKNLAFTIPDIAARKLYRDEFKNKSKIYYGKQVEFDEILQRIADYVDKL